MVDTGRRCQDGNSGSNEVVNWDGAEIYGRWTKEEAQNIATMNREPKREIDGWFFS